MHCGCSVVAVLPILLVLECCFVGASGCSGMEALVAGFWLWWCGGCCVSI